MNAVLAAITGMTLLTVIGIAFGGTFMLRVVSGVQGANELQKTYFRAGHAHAGVLVTLGLVVALLTDAAGVHSAWALAGTIGVLSAAIFIPAGFFLSVLGKDPKQPNRMAVSLWIGAATLVIGLLISGVAVAAAGISAI
ncbi:hypothetical protein BFN03_12705 [Rhodococcus sp. WMMA185]|uniref:hypothetical protein n=1 Tax=Rhodococcus sp. WMMA185 TaxID=679318 RepID=UPI000878C47B|nr:hypothetical protein BFN03_12705 [Rhodococcus sp. WMMA185]